MNRKRKILAGALTAALLLTLSIPAFATSGDVAGAVEQTWTSAQGQIKTVVNNVVFPVLDVILAVLFFVKVGSSYFECAPVEVAQRAKAQQPVVNRLTGEGNLAREHSTPVNP